MKRTKTFLALLAVLIGTTNVHGQYYAYDFSATAPSGQTLYYKIYDSTQVGVVSPYTRSSDSNYVSGDLVIPETVSYCGTTYTVTRLMTHNFMIGAFFNCKSLTSINVPNTVKFMGEYSFSYCSSLVSVHLPDSIASIPSMAFEGCTSLPKITIGRCVTSIFSDAFHYCRALMEMHLLNSVAPSVGYRALWDIPDTARICIPCGSTASYMSVQEWSRFFPTFIEEPGFVLDVTASNEEQGSVEIVSAPTCNAPQATMLATANEGYHFSHWSNGSTENPLTITLTSDTTIVAYFSIDTFTITATSNNEAMGTVEGGGVYAYGDTITLTATANDGFYFSGWSITPGYTEIVTTNPFILIAQDNYTAVAHFEADSTESITGVDARNAKVYTLGGCIVVEGAEGETVHIFDILGRSVRNDAIPTGIYLVKVGNHPAQKVIVVEP